MIVTFRLSSMKFGGAERVFLSVARILKETHQIDVHFVVDCLGQGETETLVIESGFKLFGLSCKRTLLSIIPFKHYINTQKPDIIISGYTDTNMAALLSKKLAKHQCKVIVSEHASLKEHWQHASWKRRLLLNIYVRFGYYFADHILAVSKGIASQIIKMGHSPDKVSYIYNPVRFNETTIKQLHPREKNSVPTILSIGRITKQKDYQTLLQAFNLLNTKVNAKLIIVGAVTDESEKAKLTDYIEANGLGSKVEFVGFTENVHIYYALADVFALSSAWEGFGNVLVEALAFGLPIVSTNCNHGPAEVLEHGKYGKLVPVGDSIAMATALDEVIQETNIDHLFLQKRAQDFSESQIANEYWSLLQSLSESNINSGALNTFDRKA